MMVILDGFAEMRSNFKIGFHVCKQGERERERDREREREIDELAFL